MINLFGEEQKIPAKVVLASESIYMRFKRLNNYRKYEVHLEKAVNEVMAIIYQMKIDILKTMRDSATDDIVKVSKLLI